MTSNRTRCLFVGFATWALLACSSHTTDLAPGLQTGGAAQGGGTSAAGGSGGLDLQTGGPTSATPPAHPALADCPQCEWVDCPAGSATTVSGFVHTPAETNADPLYNAVVYVPSTKVEPFTVGVSCDHCGTVSGKPVAAALTGTDGKFSLTGVPTGSAVPLVVQLGRWRRQIVIPEIKACVDNPLPDELTRFPRNRAEGDIPAMALVTSPYDPEECILRKIGIDDAEFTSPSEPGRVHIFSGLGATQGDTTPDGSSLWGDATELARYDLLLLPCASTPESVPADAQPGSATLRAARTAVANYANAGGRVFTTDLSYSWITGSGSPFNATAKWVPNTAKDDFYDPLHTLVDTAFPKGQALADWLSGVGATTVPGELDLNETFRRSLSVNAPTQRWLYSTEPVSLQTFTFNTPLQAAPDQQCGRVLYSSFHIAGATSDTADEDPTLLFPSECTPGPLTPQERVLEFLLFDLASCVQVDTKPPQPPDIVK